MYNRIFITGDIHADITRISELIKNENLTINDAIIILGDVGFNYYGSKKDVYKKSVAQGYHVIIYCVRGNHEARPQDVPGMLCDYDDAIDGYVYYEMNYPNIRYLMDGGVYDFNGYKTLVIGGAYSVDKEYRLKRGWNWFQNEQLDMKERGQITRDIDGCNYDFVLTHTCPIEWEPRDLFLPMIDQSRVDKTMEGWLSDIRQKITYNIWLFGHYHDDRLVRPHVGMYFKHYDSIEDIWNRWNNPDDDSWRYLKKDPKFYEEEKK